MDEYKTKEEYQAMEKELANFKKIYNILKMQSSEIINNMENKDTISYFCIAQKIEKSLTNTYITFYREDGKQLIQLSYTNLNNSFIELFDSELLKEVDVESPANDGFSYRGFMFNYNEEPYFIKQILFEGIKFDKTELIKEISEELNFYKDKIINKNSNIFDYTETNSVLNKYKFEEE